MKKEQVRLSNLELLRIVAMIFIILWHVSIHITKGNIEGENWIKSVTCVGVNLFVMISGYFNIRLSCRTFLNLILTVFFYSFSNFLITILVFDRTFSIVDVINILFPMSRLGLYWFVSCYLMLMLLSPMINLFLHKSSVLEYVAMLVIMGYICCVSGWLFNNQINIHGYTTFNMIFIYMLGDSVRRFDIAKKIKPYSWLIMYILFTLMLCIMWNFSEGRAGRYNNPILIMSTVALFSFFVCLQFDSPSIRKIARCMFPVYLIQDGYVGLIAYKFLYKRGMEMNFGGEYWWLIIVYVFSLFVLALFVEPIRRKIMEKRVTLLAQYVSDKIHTAEKYLLSRKI